MPVADHGQWDTFALLSAVERLSPLCRLLDPVAYNQLVQLHDHLVLHPVPPEDLQEYIVTRIDLLNDLYTQHPNTDPLFHVEELIARSQPSHPAPATPPRDVEMMLLMCLPRDPPGNVNPNNGNAPSGPTVDYVVDRNYWLGKLADGRIVHVAESAPVCLSDPLAARGVRLLHAGPSQPTARLFSVMSMLLSVMCVSITHYRHIRIRTVVVKGMWAIKTAQVHPALRRVELDPIRRNSIVFGGLAAIDYHPRIAMTSRHLVVRTLHHGRECMRDVMDGVNVLVDPQNALNVHVLTFEELYLRRAATLDVGVDDWTNVVHALQLDMTNLPEAFAIVSQALQNYVREFGTGTHGAQGGPAVYTGYPTGRRGGCSMRKKRKVPVAGTETSEVALRSASERSLTDVLASNDLVTMADLLAAADYLVEELEETELRRLFEAAMPCLELQDRLAVLAGTAEKLLPLFDIDMPLDALRKQIASAAQLALLDSLSSEADSPALAAAADEEDATTPHADELPAANSAVNDAPSDTLGWTRPEMPPPPGSSTDAPAASDATISPSDLASVPVNSPTPALRDTSTLSADERSDKEHESTPESTEPKGKGVAVAEDSASDMDISEASASSDMDFGRSDDEMTPAPIPRAVGSALVQVGPSSTLSTSVSPLEPAPSSPVNAVVSVASTSTSAAPTNSGDASASSLSPPPAYAMRRSAQDPLRFSGYIERNPARLREKHQRATFRISNVVQDSMDRQRPLTDDTLIAFIENVAGPDLIGKVSFVGAFNTHLTTVPIARVIVGLTDKNAVRRFRKRMQRQTFLAFHNTFWEKRLT